MPPVTFTLDPRIAADTTVVGDLSLSRLFLMKDGNYPWLLLVPRRDGLSELIDLDAPERGQLMEEVALASETLRRITGCDKLNVAALGNRVTQLHVHVIARFASDVGWPDPVWGAHPALERDAETTAALVASLRRGFGDALTAAD
jgi:diadenosine tetraphosphate (Ap4A) HIT family hydrolase